MDNDFEALYKWIDSYPITRQKRNINRDFSDAVPLAEILKKHYPRHVDLHNYSPQNSLTQKLVNWDTLNRKVLSKIHMPLSRQMIEKLARAEPGAIEKVLLDLKVGLEKKDSAGDLKNDDVLYVEGFSSRASELSVIPVKIKSGSKILEQKMVAAEKYKQMEDDLNEKDAMITTLKSKVGFLENMVSAKEERIQDLTQQIQLLMNAPTDDDSNNNSNNSKGVRFFNNIF